LSSSAVKEIARHNGPTRGLVPENVHDELVARLAGSR
jgi:phosphopantetheine adenylyltransferase